MREVTKLWEVGSGQGVGVVVKRLLRLGEASLSLHLSLGP